MNRPLYLLPAAAAALLAAACSGPSGPPVPGENGTMNPNGSDADISSYAIMADWDGCTALDDLAPFEAFMGVTDWTYGLTSTDIPGGMDGEAYNCSAFQAALPVYTSHSEATGTRHWAGGANIDVGVAPWDDDAEAEENFDIRVDQLLYALETGGTEYTNVTEGEFAGDWDATFLHAGNSDTGYVLSAIARKGDLVLYAFLDYSTDPGAMHESGPVYPFTDATFTTWVLEEYLPQTYTDVMALKAQGTEAGQA